MDSDDYNILSYFLRKNIVSYDQVISWAFAQHGWEASECFIEKVSVSLDANEVIDLIGDTYQVYGKPSNEFLIGEIANKYSDDKCSLYAAISHLLFDLDFGLSEREREELYLADDYFSWHDSAELKAKEHALPILHKYLSIYTLAVSRLGF
ncbi:hypothetical protein L4C34_12705 [Vibrio profundum]|uniref:hypothetical protein n=1 Tax=Vibrio profundum TaxID=2910247 RepID=UPI003D0FB744